jgi:hypothetical protein
MATRLDVSAISQRMGANIRPLSVDWLNRAGLIVQLCGFDLLLTGCQ